MRHSECVVCGGEPSRAGIPAPATPHAATPATDRACRAPWRRSTPRARSETANPRRRSRDANPETPIPRRRPAMAARNGGPATAWRARKSLTAGQIGKGGAGKGRATGRRGLTSGARCELADKGPVPRGNGRRAAVGKQPARRAAARGLWRLASRPLPDGGAVRRLADGDAESRTGYRTGYKALPGIRRAGRTGR